MNPFNQAVATLRRLNLDVFDGLLDTPGYELEEVCDALPGMNCTEVAGNFLFRPADLGPPPKIVVAKHAVGNIIVDCRAQCGGKPIQLNGRGSAAVFDSTPKFIAHVNLAGDGSLVFVGRQATANAALIVAGARGGAVASRSARGRCCPSTSPYVRLIRTRSSNSTAARCGGVRRR